MNKLVTKVLDFVGLPRAPEYERIVVQSMLKHAEADLREGTSPNPTKLRQTVTWCKARLQIPEA